MHSLLIYRLLSLGQIVLLSLISECLVLLQYCILKAWRSWGDFKGAEEGVARVLLFTCPRVVISTLPNLPQWETQRWWPQHYENNQAALFAQKIRLQCGRDVFIKQCYHLTSALSYSLPHPAYSAESRETIVLTWVQCSVGGGEGDWTCVV